MYSQILTIKEELDLVENTISYIKEIAKMYHMREGYVGTIEQDLKIYEGRLIDLKKAEAKRIGTQCPRCHADSDWVHSIVSTLSFDYFKCPKCSLTWRFKHPWKEGDIPQIALHLSCSNCHSSSDSNPIFENDGVIYICPLCQNRIMNLKEDVEREKQGLSFTPIFGSKDEKAKALKIYEEMFNLKKEKPQ